ncbi:MAG TPA: VOC family protein [Actinomycetota bacterium]|nr:VOC family protein [Actinomycetota bacterium]
MARAHVHGSQAVRGVLPAGCRRLGDAIGGEPGAYQMLMVDGQPVGGIAGPRPDQSGGPEAHCIAYLGTDDVDAAARTAEELGGEVLLPPVDVPGMGGAAVLRDPQGAAFGVFASES